jgi:hypothetical protein
VSGHGIAPYDSDSSRPRQMSKSVPDGATRSPMCRMALWRTSGPVVLHLELELKLQKEIKYATPSRWHCEQISREVRDTGSRKAPPTPLNSSRRNVEGNNTASSRRKILSVILQTATDLQATLTSEIVTHPSMPLAKIRIGNHVRPRNYGLIPARLLVECLEPTESVAALRILGTELPSSGAIFWLRSHEAWNAA